MTETPPWWAGLTTSPRTARLGIAWRPPSEWDDDPKDEVSLFGTMRTGADEALDARIRAGKVLVGTGPEVMRRGIPLEAPVHWYLDPAEPSRLWCALGPFYFAWLWVPVEPEPAALAEVISHSHPKPSLTDGDMTGFTRGYLGNRDRVVVPHVYSGDMVQFNGHDLDRYFVGVQYAETGHWASSHTNDPLRDDFEASPISFLANSRSNNAQAQRLGRIPSMTWRMLHSRAYLSFEIHTRYEVYVSVRYRPSPASHRPVVERLNRELDFDYPTDLPLDVIGALNGFLLSSEGELAPHLDVPYEDVDPMALRVHAALWCGDMRRTRRLADYVGHPSREVRVELARLANWYGYAWLAEELALAETEPELREAFEDLAVSGGNPDTYNAFNDYFSDLPIMIDDAGRPVATWSDDEEDEDYENYEDEDDDGDEDHEDEGADVDEDEEDRA